MKTMKTKEYFDEYHSFDELDELWIELCRIAGLPEEQVEITVIDEDEPIYTEYPKGWCVDETAPDICFELYKDGELIAEMNWALDHNNQSIKANGWINGKGYHSTFPNNSNDSNKSKVEWTFSN